ncbi:MAG: hypothetical protein F4Y37_12625 [Caldilineaceae bacterium SB0664_bin_22]|nr:hypothetical protein [Caldilineaceae bacterium SB0664_bin_22]
MTKGTHLLRSALLALLALAVISGGSLAAGDLFDDDYKDCPHKTRLRDDQISDLSVARDSDDENEVNVSWAATDPSTWGLGPNAYSTSLVVILDDGSLNTETLSLGSKKTTFDGVDTGRKVTVQMAIVVDTADGKYLISDILEKSINQSLTEPSFSGSWYRIRAVTGDRGDNTAPQSPDARLRGLDRTPDAPATPDARFATVDAATDFQYDSEKIANGAMYYIGYNENFANYTEGTASYTHSPSTQRLRIGLAHSSSEISGERDDVGFDAYIIRITDSDGDVVDEGDDVKTVPNNYGTERTFYTVADTTPAVQKTADRKLFIADLTAGDSTATPPTFPGGITINSDKETIPALQNVRIVNGEITVGMHLNANLRNAADAREVTPASLSIVKVGVSEGPRTGDTAATYLGAALAEGDVYANPPDEYRNFPIDTLSSDVRYKITAWAINEDDEVISPVATLTVRPINERVTLGADALSFTDYLNAGTDATAGTPGIAVASGTLIVTEFTVIE